MSVVPKFQRLPSIFECDKTWIEEFLPKEDQKMKQVIIGKDVYVTIEVPGANKDTLVVEVGEGYIETRYQHPDGSDKKYTCTLAGVDVIAESATASVVDGILTVKLPLKKPPGPVKVPLS